MDVVATIMIGGKLLYHHRKRAGLYQSHSNPSGSGTSSNINPGFGPGINQPGAVGSSPYLPVAIIFIESAMLSSVSKVLHLSITATTYSWNLAFIPICVSAISAFWYGGDIDYEF